MKSSYFFLTPLTAISVPQESIRFSIVFGIVCRVLLCSLSSFILLMSSSSGMRIRSLKKTASNEEMVRFTSSVKIFCFSTLLFFLDIDSTMTFFSSFAFFRQSLMMTNTGVGTLHPASLDKNFRSVSLTLCASIGRSNEDSPTDWTSYLIPLLNLMYNLCLTYEHQFILIYNHFKIMWNVANDGSANIWHNWIQLNWDK